MLNGAVIKPGKKSCEIKGGGQEIAAMMLIPHCFYSLTVFSQERAAMMLMLQIFNNGCVHC